MWTLNAFGEEGPISAAEAAAASPIADSDEVEPALEILRDRFGHPDAQGPSNYARFFLGGRDDAEDERMRLRRQAQGTVRVFLQRWEAIRGA